MHVQYRYKFFRADESLYQMHNGRQETQVDQKVKQRLCNYYFCLFLWRSKQEQNVTRGPQESGVCLILSVSVITIAFNGDQGNRTNFWTTMCDSTIAGFASGTKNLATNTWDTTDHPFDINLQHMSSDIPHDSL